ncbi:hypothetical protein ACTU6V_12285 [Microbacterium sp. A204]|uniref:hypothetical protein n=1 Tax=Microbacterium sp. A204 TaxID=3457321 RepID=UPI003FD39A90
MIYLDVTRESIVVVCQSCGIWHVMAFTRLEAWERAADHEARAHPSVTQARDALSTLRKRTRRAV